MNGVLQAGETPRLVVVAGTGSSSEKSGILHNHNIAQKTPRSQLELLMVSATSVRSVERVRSVRTVRTVTVHLFSGKSLIPNLNSPAAFLASADLHAFALV